jgi:hypothetical protein
MFEENDFDNFDPDNFDEDTFNSYDPDNATGKIAKAQALPRSTNKMQINISITNSTAQQLKVELFSALDSIVTRKKAEYIVGNYTFIPLASFEGQAQLDASKPNTVGFNQDGNLEIRGNAGDPKCIISCNEYPYLSLLESTKYKPFQVTRLRYTVATDAQIDNNIKHFRQTMGGGVKENTISPRAYFKPNQFQGKTIDIDQAFTIDGRSGLLLTLNAAEVVRLSLFINV